MILLLVSVQTYRSPSAHCPHSPSLRKASQTLNTVGKGSVRAKRHRNHSGMYIKGPTPCFCKCLKAFGHTRWRRAVKISLSSTSASCRKKMQLHHLIKQYPLPLLSLSYPHPSSIYNYLFTIVKNYDSVNTSWILKHGIIFSLFFYKW